MANKRPQLAKLSRPRLHKALVRERLLTLLDQKREHPVLWIVAPPGAGKTTLAASYLDEAKVHAIWFQIDAGDSDPATFFYYLKQAIEAGNKRKAKPLQLFTPEYLSDIKGFARRFLRDAFLRLPEDALLVFDNYHELQPQSPLHAGFAAALTEIPVGANILILSRTDPPSPFAQAIVNQTMTKLTWEDIKLTPDEARQIANARGVTDSETIDALQQQTDGWVAGLTLLLERSLKGESRSAAVRADTLETVFEYFGHVIFEQASSEAQEVMLRTALLPSVTPVLAELVTGHANSIRHIRALHRRHLFVSRTPGEADTYQYHAMFLAFLRVRSQASLSSDEIRTIRTQAATSLAESGEPSGAFELWVLAGNLQRAEHILIESAPNLIAQGRWRTLQEWVATLPKNRLEANPWIGYWLGQSYIWVDPAAAQTLLGVAYDRFVDADDMTGQALSAIGMLETFQSESDFRKHHRMDVWIERLGMLLEQHVSFASIQDEIRAHTVMVYGCYCRNPDHPSMRAWIDRMKEMAGETEDPNIKVLTASALLVCLYIDADVEAVAAAEQLAAPALRSREVSPRNASVLLAGLGYGHYTMGRYKDAFDYYDRSDNIATDHGLISILLRTARWRTLCAWRAGLRDLAEESMARAAELRKQGPVIGSVSPEFIKAAMAYQRGDYGTAISSALAVDDKVRQEGEYLGTILHRIVCANILVGSGEPAAAKRLLELARSMATGPNTSHFLGSIALNQAWAKHVQGDETQRNSYLQEALEWAHDKRGRLRYHWFTNALQDLLSVAVEQSIDPQMALQLARDLNIRPRASTSDQWPWPVKVYTLGEFKLLIDNQPPTYSRKMPRKVLALLKLIICWGCKDVSVEKLTDILWPNAEGDSAQDSMSATLRRLRKLLGNPEAIRQSGGQVTLNSEICWVDAMAFERQLDGDQDMQLQERALRLYRGAFLGNDDSAAWMVPMREHLRAKFTDMVGKLGASFEEAGRDDDAIALYLHGIDADNLIESFYRGLMRCHQRKGERSEAISTYRHLRDILSVTLGIEPSSATQRIMESLRER